MLYIKIADLKIQIDNKYNYVRGLCRDYIIDECEDFDLSISVSEKEIDDEIAVAEVAVSRGYAEGVCIYRNICYQLPTKFNSYLLHSALIEYEGKGYAFAAKSGTGKSTHISIWQKVFGDGVRIINGDKPIVRYIDGDFIAYGTPWCGKEGFAVNDSVPLRALCFIERSPTNSIERIPAADAVLRVFHQILTPRDAATVDALFPLLDETLKKVPCYLLKCNMDDEAAIVAYNGMNNEL
ncbi:MAG: hypothetical protein J6A83_03645 [Clostridia bacterium]|nr:hypothetical protein [Clostridia bacterium]